MRIRRTGGPFLCHAYMLAELYVLAENCTLSAWIKSSDVASDVNSAEDINNAQAILNHNDPRETVGVSTLSGERTVVPASP